MTTELPRRKPAGRASKLVLAGGAVGLSFGLVGAMVAASQEAQAAEPVAPVQPVQRVVVPQPAAAPTQIIVIMPDAANSAPLTTIEIPAGTSAPSIPDQPAAPAPVRAAAPVSESSGS